MLSQYRVIDLTSGGASLAGQILADLGADVILVEPPGGVAERHAGPWVNDRVDPNGSIAFWALHRNERSVVLDLGSASGRADLFRLLQGSDVLIESRPTAELDASGLAPETLLARDPRLIVVSISAFGRSGPKAGWAATDLTITASSGVMAMTGDEDRAPLSSSVPQAWLNAGADAAVGALLALTERARSGLGQHVEVSAQTSMMMAAQSYQLSHAWGDDAIERMAGGARAGPLRIRLVYPCRDGYVNFTFLFGPAIGPFTARMFQWLHEEGYVDAATRDKDWIAYGALLASGQEPLSELARCSAAVERFTRAHTKAELYRGAFERRVLIVPLSDVSDLARSAQLRARGYWTELAHEDLGISVAYPGPFAKLSDTPIRYRRRPPRLGEHQRAVLDEPPRAGADATPPTTASTAPALEGLRVFDLSWVYAGPAVTRVLADHGATVISIDSLKKLDALRMSNPFKDRQIGAERSGNFHNANAGKLGLGLDLSAPEGRQIARRLADWADVVVENFTPKTMRAWGLDYATVHATNPGLIMLSTCLNGQTGPEASLAGFGTMGAALAGFGFLTGWPDRPPSAPFGAYTDYVAPRFALSAILAALDERRRTGRGQHIDCAQVEAGIHMIASAALDYQVRGHVQAAQGNAHSHDAPSGVYPVQGKDAWIALAAPSEATWRALCQLAGAGWERDARFATPANRREQRAALDLAIADWTQGLDGGSLEASLQRAGIPAHRVSRSADLFDDPQLLARRHFVELTHQTLGPILVEASRLRLSRTPARAHAPGPMIGEHNDEILKNILGLTEGEITALALSGALE